MEKPLENVRRYRTGDGRSVDLKNCPFCDENDFTINRRADLDGMTFIICEPCGMVVSFQGNELLDDTVVMFNQRTP